MEPIEVRAQWMRNDDGTMTMMLWSEDDLLATVAIPDTTDEFSVSAIVFTPVVPR
jgi:hypothetical protein